MFKTKTINRDRDLLINFYLLLATILLLGMGGANQNAVLFPENVSQSQTINY